VVITLSAYTQPPPIDTKVALSELPQMQIRETNEIRENDQDSFAEILAGKLRETGEEEQRTAEESRETSRETSSKDSDEDSDKIASEFSIKDFSDAQIDAAAFAGEGINFLAKPEAVIAEREEIPEITLSEAGISEIEIPENYSDILSDMEDMRKYARAIPGEDAELPQNFFDAETLEQLADFSGESVTATAVPAGETISADARGKEIKNDGDSFKSEKNEVSLLNSAGKETASLQKETEKDSRAKLGEPQTRNRRDKLSFEVRDMRSGADNQNNVTQVKAGAQIFERVQGAPVRELTLELRLPGNAQSTAQTAWEAKAGGTAIENLLARELHQNFNGDIVRHASMALHDGGEGVIKLALKPDSLGNVKIHLKMSENKITGHIVVESEEALNAFRKEITSLEQAFRDSGFTNAQLDLSLTADQRNADQEQKAPSFLPGIAASRYDESYAGDSLPIVDVFFGQRQGTINMLA
jgi:flagellar hook-length control protein FliK